ncbi:MAG: DUF115 domain-containing protein [Candidatus Hydrogenedentota bacterium]|nr:MAG: DUF115 domain-containing protein [Candidatus Hydrogenedentota bacterium]
MQPEWEQNLNKLRKLPVEKRTVQINGIWYHSNRDAVREAKRNLKQFENFSHIVFVGAGLGHSVFLAEKLPFVKSILWLEADPEIHYYISHLYGKISSKKIQYYFCENPSLDTLEEILPFFQGKPAEKTLIFPHAPSLKARAEKMQRLLYRVQDLIKKRSINQATLIKFQNLWNQNILLNSYAIYKSKSLYDLENLWQGQHFLIVGAGPSLSMSLEKIRKYQDSFVLLAADTAAIPLAKNGIECDLVFAADPQWLNVYFALNEKVTQFAWALDPAVCSNLVHFLHKHNANLYFWKNPFETAKIFQPKNAYEVAHGGSASTNAFSFAMACKPASITLIGQDLSFTQQLAHLKGAVLEEKKHEDRSRFQTEEMHNFKQLSALEKIPVRSITGENVFTNAKMKVFIDWFENQALNHPAVKMYNATEAGCLLQGFDHIPLEKIVELGSFSKKVKVNHSKISFFQKSYQSIQSDLNRLQKETMYLADVYNKLMKNSKKDFLLKEARKFPQANQMIGYGAQKEILEITEGTGSAENETKFYVALYKSSKRLLSFLKKVDGLFRQKTP